MQSYISKIQKHDFKMDFMTFWVSWSNRSQWCPGFVDTEEQVKMLERLYKSTVRQTCQHDLKLDSIVCVITSALKMGI